jgi:hypothetical protein
LVTFFGSFPPLALCSIYYCYLYSIRKKIKTVASHTSKNDQIAQLLACQRKPAHGFGYLGDQVKCKDGASVQPPADAFTFLPIQHPFH